MKLWRDGEGDPRRKGLEQLDGYLARLRLPSRRSRAAVLVVFDRRTRRGRAAKPRFEEATTPAGRRVTVLRA